MKQERLLSVGIDIGTTTTQLIFSRLTVENAAAPFSVPEFSITQKEILYRSGIHFTPLLSEERIDADGLRELVSREYALAGVLREDIGTGAVIITGETARKENARQVLHALSGFAGDFVVATAGPRLESILAGKGSGAQSYSRARGCTVVNLDIGGGTTNFACFASGRLCSTGCVNVGGRLLKIEQDGTLCYVSPVLRPYFDFEPGQKPGPERLQEAAEFLADILEQALRGQEVPEGFLTDCLPRVQGEAVLFFSGGVAALMDGKEREPLLYGDLGVLLAQAVRKSSLCSGDYQCGRETIRATVIGAGSHTTELSGSTIFYTGVDFPLKNLPVACLEPQEAALGPEALARCIRDKLGLYCPHGETAVLGLQGRAVPKFSELCRLADGLALGMGTAMQQENPLIVALEADMGKALGQALHMLLPGRSLLCLDGLRLQENSYLDIGCPLVGGQVLPVVIKTLAIG